MRLLSLLWGSLSWQNVDGAFVSCTLFSQFLWEGHGMERVLAFTKCLLGFHLVGIFHVVQSYVLIETLGVERVDSVVQILVERTQGTRSGSLLTGDRARIRTQNLQCT